ncbi:ATPase_gene1 domain-containing protein [Campylobacter blaseri]|uniref:Arginine biosynthesis protein ArgJ n=1 Tax=Campylobacter blaseri TaxID=2042961 RepID=A0A2P8QZX9_9BACT|nr:AtpZ/AtpI family protein [Campylobacter blaseri]PSM51798.1 hypothetical protein CQ405_06635 [Campylobacter blaseri]PSM53589.1 hypothetical protein CRN67_06640 [Campylobacter blaseri]QKF86401.1 ATPase_gene1 domain-containing protein [Campylobacter blaseri]
MRITKNFNNIIRGADSLSLGISIVAAIAIGFFIGHYLTKLTGWIFFTYFFTFIGICSACLNIYRGVQVQKRDMEELENDPKYKKYKEVMASKEKQKMEDLEDYEKDEFDVEDEKWEDK